MKDETAKDSGGLPVHRVWTELGDDDAEVRWTVSCPARNRTLELDTCERCPHLRSMVEGEEGPSAVLCRGAEGAPRRPSFQDTRVDELMTRDVYCANEELRAEELVELFSARRVGGVPVLDEQERLVGVVSRTDLLHPPRDEAEAPALHPERADATAGELMSRTFTVVEEGTSLASAAAKMAAAGEHRLLVVSREGRVVGLLTALDVVRWVAARAQSNL